VLGKNGEPKAGVDVALWVKVNSIKDEQTFTLTTDKEGRLSLGAL
jgi:5-hydroxyisourate hydrolase-like protein (transthyretin family)